MTYGGGERQEEDTMNESKALCERFFEDCNRDGRKPNLENLRFWLWFSCDASLREEVAELIRADERFHAEG